MCKAGQHCWLYQKEAALIDVIAKTHSTMRLPHAGTSKMVAYEKLYVQPQLILLKQDEVSAREELEQSEASGLPMREVLEQYSRLVVMGDPGAGKSTSALKLVHDSCVSIHRNGPPMRIPFFVVLRDYIQEFKDGGTSIVDQLVKVCNAPYHVQVTKEMIEYWLLNGRAMVVFDGLDELLDTSLRRDVVELVEGFAYRFPQAPILVTTRRVGYEEAPLDSDLFQAALIDSFEEEQIEAYARKWFALDDSVPDANKDVLTSAFLADAEFVQDLTSNPLMLSLMCGLYSSERYIPKNRPDVYERCALLLFEKWDKQRGIVAPLSFDMHVQPAIRSLALWLYPRKEAQLGVPKQKLVKHVIDYLLEKRFDDVDEAECAANEFIDFCKGRAWVLTDLGADLYGFTHRTFLEYFAASQLAKKNSTPDKLMDQLLPHIKASEWEVVAQLAVQILGRAVDDGADDFLQQLIQKILSGQGLSLPEIDNCLRFACRALEFTVPRPPILQTIVQALVDFHSSMPIRVNHSAGPLGVTTDIGGLITFVAAENRRLAAKYFHAAIRARLHANPLDERATAVGIGTSESLPLPGLARGWSSGPNFNVSSSTLSTMS